MLIKKKKYKDEEPMIFTCQFCAAENIIAHRSSPQNRYFHLMIGLRSKHSGYPFEEEKCEMKKLFGYYYISDKGTLIYEKTSKMPMDRFSKFIDEVYMQCVADGIHVLSPDEFYKKLANYSNDKDNS